MEPNNQLTEMPMPERSSNALMAGVAQVDELLAQIALIQRVMRETMKEGEHHGIIPGCKKPSLYKAGAEKLSFIFRMAPEFAITEQDLGNGHREVKVLCTLKKIGSGVVLGQGVGSCSSMEAKYRYRTGPKEGTGKPVPKEYWDHRNSNPEKAMELIGGKGHSVHKNEAGAWEICIQGEKVEHDNPADFMNTVLKMAKKRAHVDAVLTATAASDIFTQDVEDMAANAKAHSGDDDTTMPRPPTNPKPKTASEPPPNQNASQGNPEPIAFDGDWREVIAHFPLKMNNRTLGDMADDISAHGNIWFLAEKWQARTDAKNNFINPKDGILKMAAKQALAWLEEQKKAQAEERQD